MARLFLPVLVLLMVALSEGVPHKPKKIKCKDKNFPLCYKKDLYCPDACLRDCEVDCATCQPVCVPPLAPVKVKCQDRKYRRTCDKEMYCPASCPKTCVADCFTCQPVCPPTGYTPPPVSPRRPPPPVVTPTPPTPPAVTPSSSPPVVTPSPPTPPAVTPSPSPPVVTPSPPTPPAVTPSPPPPVVTPSPSPPVVTPSPPIPPAVTPSPPTPPAVTPSPPPPVVTPSPPTGTPSPPPDSSEAAAGRRVRCRNRLYPSCYYVEHRCPAACPDSCEVDCVTCSPVCNCNRPGAVCQDPRFIGADGITFYFHGKMNKDFCIVSDTNLHINAHFIGRRNENMGRDFTWVQSLGILFDNHQIFIGAQKTATWDNAIDRLELSYDGLPIYLAEGEGAKWQPTTAPGVTITRSRDTNAVVIEVEGNFQIKATVVPITEKDSKIHKYGITDEDCFAHLDLGFKFYSLSGEVNGVLGQTYTSSYVSRVKMGADMPVLGGRKEFASSNLFSTDCAVARFNGTQLSSSNDFQYANLKCASGLDGRGVVCKR